MAGIRERLGKFGSRFAFEFYLETMREQIVEGLRGHLASLKPEDVRRMVREDEFPPLDLDASALDNDVEHLEGISTVRLMEYLAEARPDLAEAIQGAGKTGAQYMAKLRLHLLELVTHPEKSLAESTEYQPKQAMVKATCSQCGRSFPVPKNEAGSLDKCPFCGA